jgi:hypothetical protein
MGTMISAQGRKCRTTSGLAAEESRWARRSRHDRHYQISFPTAFPVATSTWRLCGVIFETRPTRDSCGSRTRPGTIVANTFGE